jgi:hypothetical protein
MPVLATMWYTSMHSKFICIETHPDVSWNVYKFERMNGDMYQYVRYDDEGLRFFTSRGACEAEVDRLNEEHKDD